MWSEMFGLRSVERLPAVLTPGTYIKDAMLGWSEVRRDMGVLRKATTCRHGVSIKHLPGKLKAEALIRGVEL